MSVKDFFGFSLAIAYSAILRRRGLKLQVLCPLVDEAGEDFASFALVEMVGNKIDRLIYIWD